MLSKDGIIKKKLLTLTIVFSAVAVTLLVFFGRQTILRMEKLVPKSEPIGTVDISVQDANLNTTFICPEHYIGLTLAFDDNKGETRDYSSNPDWSLKIEVKIVDKLNDQLIIKTKLDKTKMKYTNWHNPSSSVLLDLGRELPSILCRGQEYQLVLRILTPNTEGCKVTIFIRRFEAAKIKEIM